jgi:hypothetical protein
MSPTPTSSSAVRTPDPQSPGTSVCVVVTEETPENIEGDPHALDSAAEGSKWNNP